MRPAFQPNAFLASAFLTIQPPGGRYPYAARQPQPQRISMRASLSLGRLGIRAQVRADENRDWLIGV